MAIPHGNASIICGASYHVWDLPSVIICDDVAKDPSDRLSPLTLAKSYISESQYLARYFPANKLWPMTYSYSWLHISSGRSRVLLMNLILLFSSICIYAFARPVIFPFLGYLSASSGRRNSTTAITFSGSSSLTNLTRFPRWWC